MDLLKVAFLGFSNQWGRLSFNQKVTVGTLIGALLISSVFLVQRAQNDYDVLYSNMSVPDAAATAGKLKAAKAPFKLADGGTTILVPRDRKNELLLETAGELTSEQTVNLAKIPPVVQGDVQREWIKKINTDAIAETLRSIQGIKDAQVIVSQPENSVFSDNQQVPTASVMLMVEPGFRLREEQVKTIKNLVSHAVPGLKDSDVVIADNTGRSLEGPGGGPNGGLIGDNDIRRKEFEDEIRGKVLNILEPVVGKSNAVVAVSAVMNFDKSEARIHRVIPEGGTEGAPQGLVLSSQEQSEEYGGRKEDMPGAGATGTEEVGATANTQNGIAGSPTYQSTGAETGDSQDKQYRMSKRTTNFTHSEEDRNVVYATGTLERLTVSVVLNKVLTNREMDEIKEAVATAAGLDLNRGDAVVVKGFQFSQSPTSNQSELAQAYEKAQQQDFWMQIAYVAASVVLGLAALFIFYSLFKQPAEGQLVAEGGYSYESEEEEESDRFEQLIESAPIPVLEAKLEPEIEQMRGAINNLVTEDPAEAARVLMSFMKET